MEYFLREELLARGLSSHACAMLHFGCTSEDINNLAYALMLKGAAEEVLFPKLDSLLKALATNARAYRSHAMVGRTHGQKATPTTLGKEMAVFGHRLRRQVETLKGSQIFGKMNGAVGNYNAHIAVLPEVN